MSSEPPATRQSPMEPIELGRPVEVAPGILWLRLPLPYALDHVNVWLLDDGDGWTLIDTGIGDERSRAIWERLLAEEFMARPIGRIVATHFHPDHIGLAGWLAERLGVPLLTSRTEWLSARLLALDSTSGYAEAGRSYDIAAGLDAGVVEQRFAAGNRYRTSVSMPPAVFTQVAAGDTIEMGGGSWRVLIGEGHSPEMLTFYSAERNLLIAADQVLPRISPVVAVWPTTPGADPLRDFLATLPQYLELPEDCFVLPSHDAPFQSLHERIRSLVRHHEERLELTRRACAEPATVARIIPTLFRRKFDAHQLGFALGETLAHVNYLLHQGHLAVVGSEGGARLYGLP
ncbi:MAG: MBL fold metallo-hydrolase [Geminicoccaceae bacterium]|nr:MBL fold metallo-hydrolase [Geminicoccaceae bacterium]